MLILCEKPSVAKDFASALNASGKKGFYDGDNLIITYCVGHLYELCPPEAYNPDYKKWALENLPVIPAPFRYRVNNAVEEQAGRVAGFLKNHAGDDVVIATDAGREGELIARIAIQEAGVRPTPKFKRFWVSEALTPDVIRAGLKNAMPLADYDALAAQGFARQRADWLVGINLTRYMSVGNPPPPFSVGRVQTAVLAAVAARNNAVSNFIKVPFKELQAEIRSKDGVTINALLENPRSGKSAFPKGEDACLLSLYDAFKNGAGSTPQGAFDSVEVSSEQKRRKPDKLLNITGLQKAAYKRHGYTPEETLNLAQSLYETRKCLSYPRTPSRVMGDNNVDLFREKFELLKTASPLATFCAPSLIAAENKHIFNSSQLEDHHALIPLATLPENAPEKEQNVFAIVLESFFTVCMPDFLYNQKSLRFHSGEYVFTAAIREVIERGWKASRQNQKEDDENDEDSKECPAFNEQGASLAGLLILEKFTEPPKEFSIDTLLAFMERPKGGDDTLKLAGLGTPATRADIIKTLFQRVYLMDDKKKLFAAPRGLFLLEQLEKNPELKKITDAAQTTEWEQKLESDPEAFESEIAAFVARAVKNASPRTAFQKESLGKCPLCGKPVVETKLAYGCSGFRDNPSCRFVIWKTVAGAAVSESDAKLLLAGQKTKIKKCKKKDGKTFEAAFLLDGGNVTFAFGEKPNV